MSHKCWQSIKTTCEFENNHFFYICFAKPHEKSHEKNICQRGPTLQTSLLVVLCWARMKDIEVISSLPGAPYFLQVKWAYETVYWSLKLQTPLSKVVVCLCSRVSRQQCRSLQLVPSEHHRVHPNCNHSSQNKSSKLNQIQILKKY